MGKLLIIKNADFSANAIRSNTPVLTIDYNDATFNAANARSNNSATLVSYADTRYAELYNKHISKIELKVATAGTFSILGYKNNTLTVRETITFTSAMVGKKTEFPVSIDVAQDEIICFQRSTDTGLFYYGYSQGDRWYTFYNRVGRRGVEPQRTDAALCINIYTTDL